jgi:hypothetical protein
MKPAFFEIEAEITVYIQEFLSHDEVHCVGKTRETHVFGYVAPNVTVLKAYFLDSMENRKPEIKNITRHEILATISIE